MEEDASVVAVRMAALRREGATGLLSLGRALRTTADGGGDDGAWLERLQAWGVTLTDAECNGVVSAVGDAGGWGLSALLRAGMGAARTALVEDAFELGGGADGGGGDKAFAAAFADKGGVASREEFLDYYTGVSAGVATDDEFQQRVCEAWALAPATAAAAPSGGGGGAADSFGGFSGSASTFLTTAAPPLPDEFAAFAAGRSYRRFYRPAMPQRCFMDFNTEGLGTCRVVLELHAGKCPLTCENFRALCTGERGVGICGQPLSYSGTSMHRIVCNKFIQGGDVVRDNGKGCDSIYGKHFRDESFSVPHDRPGVLTMANSGPNSNGSQFCITLAALPHLDGKNVAFGQVVDGLDAVRRIVAHTSSDDGTPTRRVSIQDCGVLQ